MLRKQSLYLKFDPLLSGSPQRLVPVAPETPRYLHPSPNPVMGLVAPGRDFWTRRRSRLTLWDTGPMRL